MVRYATQLGLQIHTNMNAQTEYKLVLHVKCQTLHEINVPFACPLN